MLVPFDSRLIGEKKIMAPRILNPLSSARARANLAVAARPVWHDLIPGVLAVGYRKLSRNPPAGFWTARRYLGDRKYEQQKLATADDTVSANGSTVLDFRQASAKARQWFEEESAPVEATVASAFAAYVVNLREREKPTDFAETRYAHDIGPALGSVKLSDLNTKRLQSWLSDLAKRPRHARGAGGRKSKPITAPAPEDAERKRQNSANRTWGLLRAALNLAFDAGTIGSNSEWKRVKAFSHVDAPRIKYFDDNEIAKFLAVISGDFKNLVLAALHTGARFGDVSKLKVKDFANGGIFVIKGKNGKPRYIALTDVAIDFFSSVTRGRDANELMFTLNGKRWTLHDQTNRMKKFCKKAGIEHGGIHRFRHSFASLAIMNGCPIAVIAKQLGHSSTMMTERHYAHLSEGYVAQSIKKFGPTYK